MFGKKNREPPRRFPDALLAEARAHPDSWVYEIRAGIDPSGKVPPEDIVGAWTIDADGQPTGEFTTNPKFRGD